MRGTARDKAVLQFVCGALSGEQGGFYFHPSDKDPSLGTSVDEKATYLMCLRSTAIGEPREGKSARGGAKSRPRHRRQMRDSVLTLGPIR